MGDYTGVFSGAGSSPHYVGACLVKVLSISILILLIKVKAKYLISKLIEISKFCNDIYFRNYL